ncbi:FAD-dependent monooxygenase [Actinomadura rupiterrae]|uniref:FAD-dependent monooxygenase n=1 Tax=Actinomadura rupiterrae TaxID=559627 RepID=UPI0020A27998|nr:FAD-dependent monooxygenase [Actinomadura rupiterrae]MCP2337658.1 2-polyprenyl-6-methoxyphenol hydroxylase-like FAD-dependent oxidoreductase [Actinomadura rupiterrae]
MENTSVLISGASIGGPALAYWLTRYGFDVTIVEISDGPRPGGQAIDVRGPALEVAERMGVLDDIRAARVRMRGMSMVDAEGNELFRSEERTITGGDLDSPDVEILRDDLSRILAEAAGDRVEYLYGDSIAGLEQDADRVRVYFASGLQRDFDLVVGADGLHSNTRRLAFGPEDAFITHLGTYLGVWTAPNFLGLDEWQVFHQVPGSSWGGGAMSVRDNREVRVYLGFEAPEPLDYDYRDTSEQQRLLAERLAGGGWELPRLLETMKDAPDFHFDAMAQVHMDSWSSGRVVLLGDAGYCGSPLSGQGTSMAMVGAYVLAGELKEADGNHRKAFDAYERELRDYVSANQELALTNKARVEAQQAAAMTSETDADADAAGHPDQAAVGHPDEVIDFQDFGEIVNSLTLKAY